MNGERFAGICLQVVGRMKQAWGEATGDQLWSSAGRRDQIAGKARQASGIEHEQAARQLKDFQHHNRKWLF